MTKSLPSERPHPLPLMWAESVALEETDSGYMLVVDAEGVLFRFDVQGCIEQVERVGDTVSAYFAEGEAARHSVRVTAEDLEVAGKPSLEGWEE